MTVKTKAVLETATQAMDDSAKMEISPQLALFQINSSTYSNSIELYDAIPKGIWYKENSMLSKGRRSLVKKHTVKARGCSYDVKLSPKIFSHDDGEDTVHYPTPRDLLVEECLRHLATQGYGFDKSRDSIGVYFSVSLLRKKLAQNGHSFRAPDILEALQTLAGTHIEITQKNGDGNLQVTGNMLTSLFIADRKNYLGGKDTRCIAVFHPLVSKGILNQQYRMYNYQVSMEIKVELAAYMYKRMAFYWTQASETDPYRFKMNTYLEQANGGTLSSNSTSRRKIKNCLDDLVRVGVIERYEDEPIFDPNDRRKKIDYEYRAWPTATFIKEMKMWNKKSSTISAAGEILGNPQNVLDGPTENVPAKKPRGRPKKKDPAPPEQTTLDNTLAPEGLDIFG